MTTVVFKDGQFKTEDGIPFTDESKIEKLFGPAYHEGSKVSVPDSMVEVVEAFSHCTRGKKHYKKVARIIEEKEPCPKCRTLSHENCHSMHCPMRIIEEVEEKEEIEEHEVILNFFRKLADNQKPIPPEIAKAIKENLWTII